jgi:DNA repair protein RadA
LAHITSRLEEVVMEKITDITSDIIEHLKRLHINSVYQLAVQTPIELAIKMHDDDNTAAVDVQSVSSLITNARKILTESGNLSKEFSTADEMLERRKKISRYTTGSEKFNALLNGGFESQSITELAGEFGSGKSQICHTLCIAANNLIENSRLGDDTNESYKNKRSMTGNVIYIDTENTFRAERVYQIAELNGLDPLAVLETIYHCNVFNSEELESIIDNLDKSIEQYNAKLVIVDSLISLHRAEFSGRGTLVERQQRLGKMLNKLRRYADIYNIAVIITNQVVSYTDGSQFGTNSMKAAGGNIMGHGSTYRIFLKKAGKNRVATMYDSPSQPYQRVKFSISESGIQDASSYKTVESDSGW